ELFANVREMYDDLAGSQPTMDELWSLFTELLQLFSGVFCVIDGLDECEENELRSFVPLLATLNNHAACANLLVTSRNLPVISSSLSDADSIFTELLIRATDVKDDLQLFIQHRIQASQRLQRLDPALKAKLTDSLLRRADGMFIYAKFMLSDL